MAVQCCSVNCYYRGEKLCVYACLCVCVCACMHVCSCLYYIVHKLNFSTITVRTFWLVLKVSKGFVMVKAVLRFRLGQGQGSDS